MTHLELLTRQAEHLKTLLAPFALRVEVAGSVRRRAAHPNDIEICMIPDPTKYFDLAQLLEEWRAQKGNPGGRYMRFGHTPAGSAPVDLFLLTRQNWGLLFFIRTGSAEFVQKAADKWVAMGYHSKDGILTREGVSIELPEEAAVFEFLKLPYVRPEYRL